MNQKISLYIMAAMLMLGVFVWWTPAQALAAADASVTDWLEEKEPGTEQPAEAVELEPVEKQSFVMIIAKLVFYTLVILVMIYGLIKFLAIRQQKLQPNQAVKLMGGTPLGNNKSLQLVKVGESLYMIGVGDEVTLIKEFTGAEEIGLIEKDLEKQPTIFSNPTSKFPGNLFKGFGKAADAKPGPAFESLFKQTLIKQKQNQEKMEKGLFGADADQEGKSK